jgi:membrane protease YdiL (CAAX protease family)
MSTTPSLSGTHAEQSPGQSDDPDGARQTPRWPAWTAPVALLSGLLAGGILGVIVIAVVGGTGGDSPSGGVLIGSTVIQNVALLGAAVGFAWMTARPWPQDFGLRATRLGPAVGWAAVSVGGFFVVALLLSLALGVEESPTRQMLETLGLGGGAAAFVGIALVICVVAPVFEELFFRGYFFSALRSSMNVWWAAILGGLAFGLLHILNVLTGVPIETAIVSTVSLTVFGFLLCLVYWRTGSLYPCIGAHAVNNTIAFAIGAGLSVLEGLAVAAGTAVVVTFLLLAVRPLGRRAPPPTASATY